MDVTSRIELVRQVGEEILTEEELKSLFETKSRPICYDGMEPSGNIHIAQGVLRAINVNKMLKAGCKFKIWVADWFAWMNNKLEGDMDKIRVSGNYMVEVWKSTGMDTDNVEFLWAKDVMADEEYWKKVVNIARGSTVPRILRCAQIMGRTETETLTAAQIFYPCMQAADIFQLEVDIAQLGMDQRKVNILARELAQKLGYKKPVAVHHHMLMGLSEPPKNITDPTEKKIAMKMSKSNPNSAIFMTDSEQEISKKINNAYCPAKIVVDNPVLEYTKYIIFEKQKSIEIERPSKYGGNLTVNSYHELEKMYSEGNIHPLDLKKSVATSLSSILEPTRKHFEKNKKAKQLLEQVKSFTVTR